VFNIIFLRENVLDVGRRRYEYITIAVVVIVAFVMRYPFLFDPGYAVDAYAEFVNFTDVGFVRSVGDGRPLRFALLTLFESMGMDVNASAMLLQPLGFLLFCLAAPLPFLAFGIRTVAGYVGVVIGSLFFILHPFQAETLLFPVGSFFNHLAFALGLFGLWLASRRGRYIIAGCLMMVAALLVYQIAINLVFVVLCALAITVPLLRRNCVVNAPLSRESFLGMFVAAIASILFYYVLVEIIKLIFEVKSAGRSSFLTFDMIPERLAQFGKFLESQLYIDVVMKSAAVPRWSLVVVLILSIVAGLYAMRSRLGLILKTGVFSGMMLVAATGILLVLTGWWPTSRVLGGYALIIGLMIFSLWLNIPKYRPFQIGVFTIVSFCLFGLSVIGVRIHSEQKLVNSWDVATALAIYERANMLSPPPSDRSDYKKPLTLRVNNIHMMWRHPVPVKAVRYNLGISAFSVQWALSGLFRMTTGRVVKIQPPDEESKQACRQRAPWPSRDAILVQDGIVDVCM